LRFPRPIPGFRPWLAFLLRQPSFPLVFCFFCPLPKFLTFHRPEVILAARFARHVRGDLRLKGELL
jgi:hypothetical protein